MTRPKHKTIASKKILQQIVITTAIQPRNEIALLNVYEKIDLLFLTQLANAFLDIYPNALRVMVLDNGWNMYEKTNTNYADR